MKLAAVFAAVLAVAVSTKVQAYGPQGHALIANMAQAHLVPAAKAEVLRLLALENAKGLDDVSSWADAYRATHSDTGPAHYVNIPLSEQTYIEDRDCHVDKDNNRVPELTCVVAKLADYTRVLGDRSKPDAQRLEALKWVTHLLGDVHQPMHVADNQDRGGNGVVFPYSEQVKNLHAVWDSGIIEKHYGWTLGADYSFDRAAVQKAADQMDAAITPEQRRAWAPQYNARESDVVRWVNQTHLLAAAAYLNVPPVKDEASLARYQNSFWPLTQEQLQKASVRLSAVLNLALASGERCPNVPGMAFYAGPYGGTEDKLSPDAFALDAYCADLFKKTKYPNGFVGIYGSSRIGEASTNKDPTIAAANNALYSGVRAFAEKWTRQFGSKLPILTGAGPGLMEAASRGATDAGGPSIGYTTYYDPKHDPLVAFWPYKGKAITSDGLIFSSVAMRESAMLAHSAVIIIGPGGTGTAWEIFQAIETLKSNQLTPVPVFLLGDKATHWATFYALVDDMVARGTLRREEIYSRITHVENLDGLFDAVQARVNLR
jgi:predicted Rossmann-fold nucleotide-binding protein